MIIHGFMATHDAFGGSAIFSYVADLLSVRLDCYGSAIEEVRIIVYLRSLTRDPSIGLDSTYDALHEIMASFPQSDAPIKEDKSFDSFHEFLDRLPKITFHRKLKRADISFTSKLFTSEDDRGWRPSTDKCNRAMGEVLEALALLKKRIKPSDDFDVTRFLTDAAKLLTTTIDSDDEWIRIREQASAKELALNATKSEWELLEIDWDLYHPAARTILDDPFYWDPANDLAPHGNDTGADLLGDYLAWEKRNKNQSPLKFLDRELKKWGVVPIDWLVDDEVSTRTLAREKPVEMTLCNDAAIALAFAVLKMRGECPPDVVRMALAAIKRRAILVKDSSLGDDLKAKWELALTKMKDKLESVLQSQ